MAAMLSDPLTLTVLLLIAGHSLVYLFGGISRQRQQRRGALNASVRAETRLELAAWGVLPLERDNKSPVVSALLLRWQGSAAWSRIGMGASMLLIGGAILLTLASLSANAPLISSMPPTILAVTLLLQGYAFGMCVGAVLGLLIGMPGVETPRGQPAHPAARLNDYRDLQVVALPGILLAIDVALVGGLDLLYLHHFTQPALWSLAIFPGLLALACALGEWFMRRLARLPLRLTDDPALAERAANLFRARMVGLLLEREVFALFILVACQWLLQTFSPGSPSDFLYIAALPVYAVVLLSMRGLLERAQQDLNKEKAS
ncbi:MAG TPA: hypothetical protein VKT82_34825 [Ktedonobacterales bacterium]|nr:hypothetical protein [Ktedonobacterales bacterium]